jgi:excisionase family DNA binding protein
MKFLSTRQAAEELNVNASTIRRWIQSGKLRAIRSPGGAYRIPAQAQRQSGILTPADVAAELGITVGAVDGLIRQGLIIAIPPLFAGGPVRIPGPALDAHKRRIGLLPPIPRSTAPAHVQTFEDLADFYRRSIEPRLHELDLSVDEVLVRATGDRVFARSHRRLLGDLARYANWVAEGVGRA